MDQDQLVAADQLGSPARGLEDLLNYPLLSALSDRRTRRICQGTSISAGAVSHTSTNPPGPLTALEEAILIVSTGLTGISLHDVPLQHPDGEPVLATTQMAIPARTASSADNAQGTHFFLINDEGTWLLQQKKGRDAVEWLSQFPPNRREWTEEHWITAASGVKRKVYPERMDFPRRWPYYFTWNKIISNRPGTTVFFPVVDTTRQMINVLFIMLSEPDGQRPLVLDDWSKFKPHKLIEWLAWAGSLLGFVPKIPYEPVAGIERLQKKWLQSDYPLPLGLAGAMRTDYEALFHLQNLMLVTHAMGLGGWIHAAVGAPYVFERDPSQGTYGLGFRMQQPKTWRRWPPLPAPLPNPIGLDGILEALTPPYIASMNDAVDQVLDEKFGPDGCYGDQTVFGQPYRSQSSASDFLRNAERPSQDTIQYAKDICNYIYDTYGRFPAHVNAFHVPGLWLQVSHLEIEYYEKYFHPHLYYRQAKHHEVWGAH
ncbi:MAG TPA: hypothetical protein VLY04_22175 [Bryobacteraceae bacterium]|nr:hypothetical protein [Bryobacteraceae bacterium]